MICSSLSFWAFAIEILQVSSPRRLPPKRSRKIWPAVPPLTSSPCRAAGSRGFPSGERFGPALQQPLARWLSDGIKLGHQPSAPLSWAGGAATGFSLRATRAL